MDTHAIFKQTQRSRVSDGVITPILSNTDNAERILILIWSQLGDFDNLEYAWWLQRKSAKLQEKGIAVRAIGIGDRNPERSNLFIRRSG